ncbi:phage terminase small subunit P27 family [Clostridium botulinum]|nr:phage terminase small subunit P27 family [Clostridium botulinum]NFP31021.1 phage terminase small subunit P27 family [Clostridium botulinum]HBJ1646503.1 phage terminase small subunit P27 family [Clostridium botulinum]
MKKAPISLGEIGKKEWKRIYKLIDKENIDFKEKDLTLLELYCKNYEKWINAEKYLDENGYSYICSTGYPSQFPEVTISQNAQKNMMSAMRELGFSPASRSKIVKQSSPTGDTDDDMEEMISK